MPRKLKLDAGETLRGFESIRPVSMRHPDLLALVDTTSRCEAYEEPATAAMRELRKVTTECIRLYTEIRRKLPKEIESDPPLSDLSILIVDNEPSLLSVYKKFLKGVCHRVDIAASYDEAILRVRNNRYSVLVIDYQLERNGTGLDIITYVRQELQKDTPAILMSGQAPNVRELARMAKFSGANTYLEKPFKREELIRTIAKVLKK